MAATFVMSLKDKAWVIEHQNLKVGGKPLKLRTTLGHVTPDAFSFKQEFTIGSTSGVNAEGKCRKLGSS